MTATATTTARQTSFYATLAPARVSSRSAAAAIVQERHRAAQAVREAAAARRRAYATVGQDVRSAFTMAA